MRRWLYLFCGNSRWARRLLGGRWVKRIEPGSEWVQWNDSILKEYLDWPMDHKQYDCEDWL
jgi:hypothetical protein